METSGRVLRHTHQLAEPKPVGGYNVEGDATLWARRALLTPEKEV